MDSARLSYVRAGAFQTPRTAMRFSPSCSLYTRLFYRGLKTSHRSRSIGRLSNRRRQYSSNQKYVLLPARRSPTVVSFSWNEQKEGSSRRKQKLWQTKRQRNVDRFRDVCRQEQYRSDNARNNAFSFTPGFFGIREFLWFYRIRT